MPGSKQMDEPVLSKVRLCACVCARRAAVGGVRTFVCDCGQLQLLNRRIGKCWCVVLPALFRRVAECRL